MDFSELPMLPGWADFEPVLDVLHIWFNVKRPELPPIKKKKKKILRRDISIWKKNRILSETCYPEATSKFLLTDHWKKK